MHLQYDIQLNKQWVKYALDKHVHRIKKRAGAEAKVKTIKPRKSRAKHQAAPNPRALAPVIIEVSTPGAAPSPHERDDLKDLLSRKSYLDACTREAFTKHSAVKFERKEAKMSYILAEGKKFAVLKIMLVLGPGEKVPNASAAAGGVHSRGHLIDPVSHTHTHANAHIHMSAYA
jgi:hypothetical protein